jgi:hypothetical protein
MKDTTQKQSGSSNSSLSIYPKTRIKPYDGMSVSAAVWAQAHDEHRQASQAHDLLFHGSGIITGLEVFANDPPDHVVFISPGAAVDSAGDVIILPEPVAYDFGDTAEGTLYLLFGHGEREVGGLDSDVKYIQSEFVIAARPSMPKRPTVELARVTLSKSIRDVHNAANPARPEPGQLDLRFRNIVGPRPQQNLRVGLCNLNKASADIEKGWDALSGESARSSPYHLAVDKGLVLSPELLSYDLVYLYGNAAFKVDVLQIDELRAYLDAGHALLIEALHSDAHESFQTLFAGLGLAPKPLAGDDPLLADPFLFAAPPPGYHGNEVFRLGKALYSTAGYGIAWGGKLEGGSKSTASASRADIRSAHEWGINLIHSFMQHMAA